MCILPPVREEGAAVPVVEEGHAIDHSAEPLSKGGKSKMFSLKQIVTRHNTVVMNILERLLDTTSINATDVETGQTLLEFACRTGNLALAKLCYRRGAPLAAKTKSGDTPFNIATRNKNYKLMEFLYLYGIKIGSADSEGRTALHVATSINDVDGVCRLVEWGADTNARDNMHRTPLHYAAIAGHHEVAMLLLELGADLNAEDTKEYTAVAHAETNDHFKLMDRLGVLLAKELDNFRLEYLGGKGHRVQGKVFTATKQAAPAKGVETEMMKLQSFAGGDEELLRTLKVDMKSAIRFFSERSPGHG